MSAYPRVKARAADSLTTLRQHGYNFLFPTRYWGHRCHVFECGTGRRKVLIRARSKDERGIYWMGVPSDIERWSSDLGPSEVVFYFQGERHFYVVPSKVLADHFSRHGFLLNHEHRMFIFNIRLSTHTIRETGFSLFKYKKSSPNLTGNFPGGSK